MDALAQSAAIDLSEDRKALVLAVSLTVIVHCVIAVVLATAGSPPDLDATRFPIARRLCEGARCAEKAFIGDRRGPDEGPMADLGVIEATVIPRLGLAEPKAGELPKLTKYEQPEHIEEAVNVSKENRDAKEVPNKDALPRKAELDRKRPSGLMAVLGAPYDDDPRKRPTRLDSIIGQRDGSVYGTGTEWTAGNVYAGKVALAIRQQFTVPPFLSEPELKRLRVRIRVLKMNEAGQIQGYEPVENSASGAFNAAAVQAIKRFMPREGGTAYLPAPDAKTLSYINSKGMVVDLDGALFRK